MRLFVQQIQNSTNNRARQRRAQEGMTVACSRVELRGQPLSLDACLMDDMSYIRCVFSVYQQEFHTPALSELSVIYARGRACCPARTGFSPLCVCCSAERCLQWKRPNKETDLSALPHFSYIAGNCGH